MEIRKKDTPGRSASWPTVVNYVAAERVFQDGKWGRIEDNPHELGVWILLIEAELAEAKEALIKGGEGRNGVRAELIQVAALCFAALEQHGIEPTGTGGREI